MSYTKTLVAAVLIQSLCAAQGARFQKFGAGCPGSASATCPSNNANATKLENRLSNGNPQLALEINASTPVVTGFEIFTKAQFKSTVTAWILLPDAKGQPDSSKPFATGSITFDTTLGWYKATFPSNVILGNATRYFISWDPGTNPKSAADPTVPPGGQVSPHYEGRVVQNQLQWTGPINRLRWAWKINCTGSRQIPEVANFGDPALGNSKFKLLLTKANANLPVAAVLGASNTSWGPVKLPFDLGVLGAKGCNLLVSLDFPLPTASDKNGNSELPLPIPNNTSLKGKSFYAQWLVFDKSANTFGLAVSNGAILTVGDAE